MEESANILATRTILFETEKHNLKTIDLHKAGDKSQPKLKFVRACLLVGVRVRACLHTHQALWSPLSTPPRVGCRVTYANRRRSTLRITCQGLTPLVSAVSTEGGLVKKFPARVLSRCPRPRYCVAFRDHSQCRDETRIFFRDHMFTLKMMGTGHSNGLTAQMYFI